MAPVELHPELWHQIIELLVQPQPRPNGNAKRSAIRQNDLASCMRVSSLFNNIAGPHLYRRVICDYLPSLAYGTDNPRAASGIQSKRALIGHMERLFLEYYPKTEATYPQIFCGGGHPDFARVGLNDAGMIDLCTQECDWIAQTGRKLADANPKLKSLSVAVFFGGQTEIWKPIFQGQYPSVDYPNRLYRSMESVSSMMPTQHRLYLCQRDHLGPLTFSSSYFETTKYGPQIEGGPRTYVHRAHRGTGDLLPTPALPGGSARWYCPFDVKTPLDIKMSIRKLCFGISGHMDHREDVWALGARGTGFHPYSPAVNIEIFVPAVMLTQPYKDLLDKEMARAKAEIIDARKIPRARYEKDVWRVRILDESIPSCEACSWCPGDKC